MSDSLVAIRAIALAEANKTLSINDPNLVLTVSQSYLDFLNGADAPAAAKPAPKAEKPAKVSKPAPEPEPVVEGPTKVEVSATVEKLLGANKRTEAVALMKKFGASSVSTLAEDKYAAFIEAADAILMTA